MGNKLPLFRMSGFHLRYQYETSVIEEEFPFLNCTFTSSEMNVQGEFSTTSISQKYNVLIRFDGLNQPKIFILDRIIKYHPDIHVYRDGSLCLHYPEDKSWSRGKLLAHTVIPWISEWLIYYELYQYYEQWKGPEVLHSVL